MFMPTAQRRLLPYLLHHVTDWPMFLLIAPPCDSAENAQPLDLAIQAYLRSGDQHPLFDHPVVVWWSDADHALLIPCTLRDDQHWIAEDSQSFRLVRTKPLAQANKQAASSL